MNFRILPLVLLFAMPLAAQEPILYHVPAARSAGAADSFWWTSLAAVNAGPHPVVAFFALPDGTDLGHLALPANSSWYGSDIVSALRLPDGVHVLKIVQLCEPNALCGGEEVQFSARTYSTQGGASSPFLQPVTWPKILVMTGQPDVRKRLFAYGPLAGAEACDGGGAVLMTIPASAFGPDVVSFALPAETVYVRVSPPPSPPGGPHPWAFAWATETTAENRPTVVR